MVRKAAETTEETIAHPLFPLDDSEAEVPAVVATIHVRRFEGGDWQTVPAAFAPDQLTSWQQVWQEWGGGKYELVARDSHGRITARVTSVLPGEQLPLVPKREAPPGPHAPAPLPAASGGLSGNGDVMALLIQVLVGQQQQSQQMMLAFLERTDRAAQAQSQSMAQMYSTTSQLMGGMFSKMAEGKEAGRPEEVFMRGIETANALRAGAGAPQDGGGGNDLASIAETIKVVAQGIQASQAAVQGAPAMLDAAAQAVQS